MTEEEDFNKVCTYLEENKSINKTCTYNEFCINKEIGPKEYEEKDNLEYHILFGKDKKLSTYVKGELLIPFDKKNKAESYHKIRERVELQKRHLNLSEEVRTIGIARCNQIIGVYENQHQLTMIALVLTVLGYFIDATGAPSYIIVPYYALILILLLVQTILYLIREKNTKPIYFLKALLEHTAPYS